MLEIEDVINYVEEHISVFHSKRIESIGNLKLNRVLEKKNPYLFKSKYVLNADEIVKGIVSAFVSSNEETIFGDWLEGLAIFVNQKVYGGWKSGIPGIDLEFDNEGSRYIVNIKSGPNWGNSSQIAKMIADFKTAKKTLRTSNSGINVIAVNGCCYGKTIKYDKGDYFKYSGSRFWEFISGCPDLYLKIIEPLGNRAKENNEFYAEAYGKMINRFIREFIDMFCFADGSIDWIKLVKFNSGHLV